MTGIHRVYETYSNIQRCTHVYRSKYQTYIADGCEPTGSLEEAQSNVQAKVRPWRLFGTLFEDSHDLGEDKRDEEGDETTRDHNQQAQELIQEKGGEAMHGRDWDSAADHKTGNVVYAQRPVGARNSSMAKDKA